MSTTLTLDPPHTSSARKIESARRNGAKSRGPATAEGRQISSMNALKHGFSASRIVLSAEERPQFEELRQNYIARFQPLDEVESNLVDSMVTATWRQYRIWAYEASVIDLQTEKHREYLTGVYPGLDPAGLAP